MADDRTEPPPRVAVVGHANTGKTSLLRTLARDPEFGVVADEPGTTRRVEGMRLSAEGAPALEIFDTPGMEDGVALLEYLEALACGERLDGPARIARFLDTPEAAGRFEQEARVLRQLLSCDAALYVIDARDPVLGKHRDELAVLAACGRPLLPVLNFVHGPGHRAADWRDALARLGLHALVEFDTVAPPLDGEQQLYERLAMLLDRHGRPLARLVAELARQRDARARAGRTLIAELLVDVAALRLSVPARPPEGHAPSLGEDAAQRQEGRPIPVPARPPEGRAPSPGEDAAQRQEGRPIPVPARPPEGDDPLADATQALRRQVREREQACVDALLALYNFRPGDYRSSPLPLAGERWEMDLFHPQALRDTGIRVGKGMAAGAMAGAAVDLVSAGLSLGTGMLLGAAAGGLWQGAEKLGARLMGRLRGRHELTVDDAILRLLALRQSRLLAALERRGHAAREPLVLDEAGEDAWRSAPLPPQIAAARARPDWSAAQAGYAPDAARAEAVAALARSLAAGGPPGAG